MYTQHLEYTLKYATDIFFPLGTIAVLIMRDVKFCLFWFIDVKHVISLKISIKSSCLNRSSRCVS